MRPMHHGRHGAEQVFKIENPDKSGINTSNYVGKYTVPSGDAGIENGDVNGSKLSFSLIIQLLPYFRVKVWAPKPVKVRMQLQNDPNYGQNRGRKRNKCYRHQPMG